MIMKKYIILLGLALSASLTYSQVPERTNIIEPSVFSIGLTGGTSHGFLMPDDNWQYMPGWNAGITTVFSPNENWGLGLDVLYSGEGSKTKIEGRTWERQLFYLRVPVKGILFFGKYEDDVRPKLALAANTGFLMDEKKDSFNAEDIDFGLSLSAGINIRISMAVWLAADIEYYQGLLDVYPDMPDNQMNGHLGVNAGLLVGF